MSWLAAIFVGLGCVARAQELFTDPGFEETNAPAWYAWGFTMTSSTTDKHGGTKALLCSNRTQSWMGPGQVPPIKAGGRYKFQSYVKFVTDKQGVLFQTISLSASFTWQDNDKTDYLDFAMHSMANTKTGWFSLAGDFTAPVRAWKSYRLYIQGPDPGVDFLIDDASLTTVPEDTTWKTLAKDKIEQIRKSNVTFTVHAPRDLNSHDVQIEIRHKNHLFGWGSVVDDDAIIHPDYKEYQNIFYYLFNWATVGSFKWGYAKGTPDNPDYSFAVNAMNELVKHGIKVRGHNMFWGVRGNDPNFVTTLSADQLKATIAKRVQFMTGITRGKLEQWDVNNELLHGQFYEQVTQDANYTMKIFDMVHKADPHPVLCLNDYDVVALGTCTDSYVAQAAAFKEQGAPLGALGLQSHFRDYFAPDITLVKSRLDKLATTGYPLWITELTLTTSDEAQRADWMEDILTTYFAHPSVEGVIFWGFWDKGGNPGSFLVDGYKYHLNAVGRRYLNLIKSQWSTSLTHTLSSGNQFSLRGYQGDYEVLVTYRDKPIKLQQFHLGKKGTAVTINITPQDHDLHLTTTVDPFLPLPHPGTVSRVGAQTLGSATTSTSQVGLTCTTRLSALSEVGDDKTVSVECADDEVLTGCSSFLKNNEWYRDGEKIDVVGGKPKCTAVNGWRSTGPIQAIARCCKVKGLQCTYKTTGPSSTGINDKIETDCAANEYPTGCLTYTWVSEMDGSYPQNRSCVSQNDGTQFGVFSYAACCSAPGLACVTKTSAPSGQRLGDVASVTCDAGYTLAGCSVYTEYGGTAGAHVTPDAAGTQPTCIAVNGADKYAEEEGVKAVAVCCKVA